MTEADCVEGAAVAAGSDARVGADGRTGAAPQACDRCEQAGTVDCALFDEVPDDEILYDLADLFKVFSDTTRIRILFSLMRTELCVADIAQETASTQSAVSHQLRILKQAHLVKFRRDGRNILYSLADDHVYTMLAQGMTHVCE
ncbi:helix-turn-helix transcriptional regulator [bacterium]|nr:helix-turn-helix transcriptional regulator [bacterium]